MLFTYNKIINFHRVQWVFPSFLFFFLRFHYLLILLFLRFHSTSFILLFDFPIFFVFLKIKYIQIYPNMFVLMEQCVYESQRTHKLLQFFFFIVRYILRIYSFYFTIVVFFYVCYKFTHRLGRWIGKWKYSKVIEI